MDPIPISEARAGMSLSEPVTPHSGKSLGANGDVLTQELIDGFIHEGVTQITVEESVLDQSNEPESPEAKVRKMIDFRFHHFDQNPLMQSIKHAAEKHLLRTQPLPQ